MRSAVQILRVGDVLEPSHRASVHGFCYPPCAGSAEWVRIIGRQTDFNHQVVALDRSGWSVHPRRVADGVASIWIVVRGALAIFPRPEFFRDSVSYPVMTPAAAQGILDVIHWRPSFRWVVDELILLNPITFEVLGSSGSAKTMALRDVSYGVRAHIVLTDKATASETAQGHCGWACANARSSVDIYLGRKDFAGTVTLAQNGALEPLAITQDLGMLFHGKDYANRGRLRFFHAVLEVGRLQVPPIDSPLIFG